MRLRRLVWVFTIAMSVITLTGAAALVVITDYLHTLTMALGNNLESVRAAEEIELRLLWHDRYSHLASLTTDRSYDDAAQRASTEIHTWYEIARQHVGTEAERQTLDRLVATVDRYLTEQTRLLRSGAPALDAYVGSAGALEEAYGEAEQLLQINLEQADELTRDATRWDGLATWLGRVIALLIVLTVSSLIVSMRSNVYRPLLGLREAVRRFAEHDYGARAHESGSQEIREIVFAFNDMAATLERQRSNQLAFVAGIAHDLRTPLHTMKIAMATVLRHLPEAHPDRVVETFKMIDRQVDVLARLSSDLLDTMRIENGQFVITAGECDFREFVWHVTELFRSFSPSHDIIARVPAEPLRMTCDRKHFERVVNNLVSNAIKYSPKGGTVEVIAGRDEHGVFLEVNDEGLGIPPDEQVAVFEPFRRGEHARETFAGIGLGLSVARAIVTAHGGTISLRSVLGQGSTFTVRLPESGCDRVDCSAR